MRQFFRVKPGKLVFLCCSLCRITRLAENL